MLHALFEHWPSTHTLVEETRTIEKGNILDHRVPLLHSLFSLSWSCDFLGSSPSPPPQLEDLMEVCSGDSVNWESLGKFLSIPEAKLEEISLTHKDDVEKSKEHLFKVSDANGRCCMLVEEDS